MGLVQDAPDLLLLFALRRLEAVRNVQKSELAVRAWYPIIGVFANN
jgi:hypothetical protein